MAEPTDTHGPAAEPTHAVAGPFLRIAMALYADVTYDSRVLREAGTLAAAGHSVTIHCLGGSLPADAPFRAVSHRPGRSTTVPGTGSPYLQAQAGGRIRKAWARIRWLIGYAWTARAWGRMVVRAAGHVDVWHAHDLNALAAVVPFIPSGVPVIYDSHEEFLETGSAVRLPGIARRVLARYERRLVRRSFAVVTVNEGIAGDLRAAYRPRRLRVVRNCPPRWLVPAERPDRLRTEFGIGPDEPVLLFHGAFSYGRGIDRLVRAMRRPELARVHVALLGNGDLFESLRSSAADPAFGGRLHVHEAVSVDELPSWVASADAGVILLQPLTRNLILSTPNKLFECVAVGTPVIVSDLPEMRRIVIDDPDGPLGVVCDPEDDDAIGAALAQLVGASADTRAAFRRRCLKAARERLNWESEAAILVDLYDELAERYGDGATAGRAQAG